MNKLLLLVVVLASCAPDGGLEDDWDLSDEAGKADGTHSPSYGQLAAQRTPPALATVVTSLGSIGSSSLPDEAKTLRKQIGEARDYVDLFSYAYPEGDPDQWKKLRNDLDDGYELVGAFKDLFDAQGVTDPKDAVYDDSEVRDRRQPVLDWKARFLDSDRISKYKKYVAAPLLDQIDKRKASDLSPFYWGEADLEPSAKKSGIKNIALLARALLDLARDDFAAIHDLGDITKTKNHDQFHNFRKRIRSITKVARYFPTIFKAGSKPESLLLVLDQVVENYGTLNDKILAYDLAVEHGDKTKKLENEIASLWDELRHWQDKNEVDDVCKQVRDLIRK